MCPQLHYSVWKSHGEGFSARPTLQWHWQRNKRFPILAIPRNSTNLIPPECRQCGVGDSSQGRIPLILSKGYKKLPKIQWQAISVLNYKKAAATVCQSKTGWAITFFSSVLFHKGIFFCPPGYPVRKDFQCVTVEAQANPTAYSHCRSRYRCRSQPLVLAGWSMNGISTV